MSDSTPKYLTLSEAAARLRTSRRTVERMAKAGRMEGYRLGREWRFTVEQVDGALRVAPAMTTVRLMPEPTAIRLAPSAQRAIAEGRAV